MDGKKLAFQAITGTGQLINRLPRPRDCLLSLYHFQFLLPGRSGKSGVQFI